jgi:ABC-type nitrate/sulfonate/bicarbonate transport system substrate-binding protein
MATLTLAVPDLVSNSYFPAVAAAELGIFRRHGLDVSCQHIFPVDRCLGLLRDGEVDMVAGAAHAVPQVFPGWRGVTLAAALSRHMYWFLVVRADLRAPRGQLGVLRDLRIGAAPIVEQGLRELLAQAGIDPVAGRIEIAPVPGAAGPGVSFGVQAARALEDGLIDGFWANGLGTEYAVRRGAGTVLLDVRRGDGPEAARDITFPALVLGERLVARQPGAAAAALAAIEETQQALRDDIGLATRVGQALFPPFEAQLIADVVARDLPYYEARVTSGMRKGVDDFAARLSGRGLGGR